MSKSVFEQFRKDKSKVLEGVWRKVGTDTVDPIYVKVAFAGRGNKEYQNFFLGKFKDIEGSPNSEQLTKEVFVESALKYILKDWKNVRVKNSEGKLVDLPFTEKNIKMVLTECEDLTMAIMEEARNFANFTSDAEDITFEQEVEQSAKKSSIQSTPNPATRQR